MRTIDIVLPAYNEAEALPHFHAELIGVLKGIESEYRFLITYVLDRSSDDSFGVLRRLASIHKNVKIVHLSRRFGHQMSLVAGIDQSTGDAMIMMDCDLQHPPSVIPLLLGKFEQGYEVVHAIRQYDKRVSSIKRFTSGLFYKLQNVLSPIEIDNGAADFRLISRKVVRVFQQSIREQNQFLRGLFQWVGFRSTTVSFVSPKRAVGRTKYDFWRLLAFSVAGITSFSKVPLRFATFLGLAISTSSLIYGFWLISYYYFGGILPPGYTSLIVVVLFIGGLQLMVLGIIGEYLGSIFDEVKARPLYIVDTILTGEGS